MLGRSLLLAGIATLALTSCGSATPAAPTPPAALGQVVAINHIEYAVNSVDTPENVSNNQYINGKAAEGGVLVVVNWSMKNASDRPLEFYEKATMHLVDPAGNEYSSDLELSSAYQMSADLSDKMLGDTNPGITTRGADVYEVAAAAFDKATWHLKLAGSEQLISLQ